MITVGIGYKILHDFSPFVSDLTVETEVNKGFSRCNFTLDSPFMLSEFFSSANPNMNIFISEDGHNIWQGKVRSIQTSGSEVNIEGEGHYAILERRYYNDGSDEELAVDVELYENTNDNSFDLYGAIIGVAVEVQNTLGYDVPVKSFTLELQQIGDVSGKLIPFYTSTMPAGSPDTGHTDFMPIEAASVNKSGYETFEMRMSDDTTDELSDIVIADGDTFFVGIKFDSEYLTNADASNHIKIARESSPTVANAWHKLSADSNWYTHASRLKSFVYGRGKWDYYPGDTQINILTDIMDDSEYNVEFQGIDSPNIIPGLRFPLETTKFQAIEQVLSFGDSANKPLYMYSYEYEGDTSGAIFTFKTAEYPTRPNVIVRLSDRNNNYSIDFGELFTDIKIIYTDTIDGFKYQTNSYFTEIPFIESRERKIVIGDADSAEADIIAQLHAELGKEPVSDRQLTASQSEIFGLMSQEMYPMYKLRAGQFIGVEHPVQNIYYNKSTNEGYYTYFIRATSYDVMNKKIRLDLSRVDEKDILASMLT